MQCSKCGRESSDKRKICIYCGAPQAGQASTQNNHIVSKKSDIFISDENNSEVKLKHLPENVRHKIEDAVRNGTGEVVVKDERKIVQSSSISESEKRNALSMEKVITILSKMRDSLNRNLVDNNIYEKMATDIIQNYISSLSDNIRLNFVVNEIMGCELSEYLNDKMLKDLRAFVISSITDK